MIASGEVIRRQRLTLPGGRHLLAAAAVSGAGAATLSAAVWAAWGLYHFLPLAPAFMRPSRRSIMASLPLFWIISRPEMEIAEAYCVIEN